VSIERPNFLFVCEHGARGDHSQCDHTIGCSEVDRVGLLPWLADRGGWWAAKSVDERTIVTAPVDGDNQGWDQNWLQKWFDSGLTHEPIEIRCLGKRCSSWAYRSDSAKLQTLLMAIATDGNFRNAVAMHADDNLIVMKLQALHLARQHAKKHYRLRV
jgi:hypothetical protein